MNVRVQEVVSEVHAMDGDALLAPQTLSRIVEAVLRAVDERGDHERRVRAETRVTGGVAFEQSEEDRA
jgi:hypothetical protein